MTATATPPSATSASSASDLPDAPVRRSGRPTPLALRRVALGCVVTAILAGLFIGLISYQRASRLDDAAAKARQVVVLTDARSQVAAADAAATRAFLVGGVEDAEGRADYLDALAAATTDLNDAAGSGIGDTEAIASIAEGIGTYRGTIEYARALNRQNLPLGSAYLRSAGAGLATDVVDPLDAEIASVRGSIQTNASPVAVGLAVLAVLAFLACFVWASRVLSSHTRRTLNVGVVLGGLLLAVVLVVFLVATISITATVDETVDGPLRDTTQIAQARTDAFDARSSLNLALIARGSGQTYLARLDEDIADAKARIGGERDLSPALGAFADQLQAARDLDAAGSYDQAVALATSRTEGVGPAFSRFDQVSGTVLGTRADTAVADLTNGRPWLLVIAVAAVVAGVVAAGAAWSGIAQRRKEYM